MPYEDTTKLTITDWAEEDRPRERLERLGAEALSNAELLAILIGSGTPQVSAVDLMKNVLASCHNNLNTLGKMTIRDLEAFKGIGPAKAITILAACELGKRRAREKAEERTDLGSATAIYNLMHPKMQDLDVEEFHILLITSTSNSSARCASATGASRRRPSTFASLCAKPSSTTPPCWPPATTIPAATPIRRVKTTNSPSASERRATSCAFTFSTT